MWIKEIYSDKGKRDTIHQYVEFKELHDNTRRKRANREWQNEIEMLKANRINSQIKQTSCNRQQTSKNKGRKNIHSCPNLRKMIQKYWEGVEGRLCVSHSLSLFLRTLLLTTARRSAGKCGARNVPSVKNDPSLCIERRKNFHTLSACNQRKITRPFIFAW